MARVTPSVSGPAPLLMALLLLPACKVGPDYAAPAPRAPAAWNSFPPGLEIRKEALGAWWEGFQDPTLQSLIRRAIGNNLDLKAATHRVAEAKDLYRVESSSTYPEVDAEGHVFRERTSQNVLLPGGRDFTLHSVGVAASWEVDLFGRVRRAVEAAGAGVEASQEDRRNVLISICA